MAQLGAHVSVAGGVSNAFEHAAAIGADALQIFVKNASRWQAKALEPAEIDRFHAARKAASNPPVIAHASYLINLAAVNPETLQRSQDALGDELARCDTLGLDGLVLHPGAHMGRGEAAGLDRIATSLDTVFGTYPDITTKVLLENTAGQGTALGYRFEHLAGIIASVDAPERLGVCLDTCHAFAAGYDFSEYDAVMEGFNAQLGWDALGCVHLNDSQGALGARKDRHANLGAGHISMTTFVKLAQDERLRVPLLLETPLGNDGLGHERDLAALRAAL